MANPFNVNTNNNNNLHNAYEAFANSKNPQELFLKMAQNSPQMQPVLNMLRSGGNPQQIFTMMCQQRGINPQQFINQIMKK